MEASIPSPISLNADLEESIRQDGGIAQCLSDRPEDYINQYLNRFKSHIQHAKQNLYQKPRDIYFAFINNPQLDAFATASRSGDALSYDFIGVSVGLFVSLQSLYLRLLSHPENLQEVGNPNLEVADWVVDEPLLADLTNSKFKQVFPRCPVRYMFADLMTRTALDFVFFHELNHLRNGHIEYYGARSGLNSLAEVAAPAPNSLSTLEAQTLEMDADAGAILSTLNFAYRDSDGLIEIEEQLRRRGAPQDAFNAFRAFFEDKERMVGYVSMSCYLWWRMLHIRRWNAGDQERSTHPSHEMRMAWINATLFQIFLENPAYKYDAYKFVTDGAKIVMQSERAVANVTGTLDLSGILSAYDSPQAMAYLGKLQAAWATIRPELDLHKRGGNLAPVTPLSF